jgi:hypothetical protein
MFDKTFTLKSSDGSTSLQITAGPGGVKSILVSGGSEFPQRWKPITEQELIDLVEPALMEWLNGPSSAAPAPSNS